MAACPISARSAFLMAALCLLGARGSAAAQAANVPGGLRIAGTVGSTTDGHPLAHARISLSDVKDPQKLQSMVTSEDGKFEFGGLPAGKYSLRGAKRGFIPAMYDQHDQFWTAIVTGAGVDTEDLLLRLSPVAVMTGKVLDEIGEPVRNATVTLYYDDHSGGVDQIRQFRSAQTDDLGAYEITPLLPGTYFLSALAKPWYAVHLNSEREGPSGATAAIDRSLDVTYPATYHAGVTEADSATPIPVRGGERVEVDIHLNPVPALHVIFHVPGVGKNAFPFLQFQQPVFDGSMLIQSDDTRMVSPGVYEVTGIPAGRYSVRIGGTGQDLQMNGVDLSKDGAEVDTSSGEALCSIKLSVQVPGEATIPPQLAVGLRLAKGLVTAWQPINPKGEAELPQIAAGRYEVLVWGPAKPYSIARISAEGAAVSGHTLTVPAGSSASISLALVGGAAEVRGKVTRAGEPFAGAMVVLVPKSPDMDRDLFRRDQSDLDGTFDLRGVIAGFYTILAIENGWELDWLQPGVIAPYLKHGRAIEVGNRGGRPIDLADPIEVQFK